MAQIINTNIPSLNAQRNLTTSQGSLNQALQRLSSGLRVNSAKDDAAGLAIASNMDSQSRGMVVAMRNANDAISAAQTAEAGFNAIGTHLQRMRELAVQAASGQYDSVNRTALDKEYQQLASEISRVVDATTFNGQHLLNGDWAAGVAFQVGATTVTADSRINIQITEIGHNFGNLIDSNGAFALAEMVKLDTAIDSANSFRADLGAIQNRMEGVLLQLGAAQENTEAAKSRIMDADYGAETAKLSRAQILQQAGTAMLAQANSVPQNVLSLLR
ncbi:flagellin [Betaproteobacteria bacterium]|nr:flagellin [Betaproteobacteria bacterium]GHU44818.1 flagellin [Betaproteobacteria bacterium]